MTSATVLAAPLVAVVLLSQTTAPPAPIQIGFGKDAYRIGDGVKSAMPQSSIGLNRTGVPDTADGQIEVEAVIDTEGHVGETRVVRTMPAVPAVADAAVAAVKQQAFAHGSLNGKAVPVVVTTIFTVRPVPAGGPASASARIPALQFAWNPRSSNRPGVTPAKIRHIGAEPKYTSTAMRAKLQGPLEVDVIVEPSGAVGDVRVVTSLDPTKDGLDSIAVAALRQWTFEAAKQNDRPIQSRVTVALFFVLR